VLLVVLLLVADIRQEGILTGVTGHLRTHNYCTNDLLLNRIKPVLTAKGTGSPGDRTHVLVTGGAGFIGSHASLALLELGYDVTVLDNLSRGNIGAIKAVAGFAKELRGDYQYIECDLGDRALVEAIFEHYDFNAVIHFAAVAFVGESMEHPLLVSRFQMK
jgi:FlaA1/EpsC-like NDP-sugar epimerase